MSVDEVASIEDRRRRSGLDHRWLFRQAILVVGQLPEGEEEANMVLWYAQQLVKVQPKAKPA